MRFILFAILLSVLILSQLFWDIAAYFSPEIIQDWLVAAGWGAPFIYMIMMALAVVVSPIPSVPLDIAAGIFFGPWLGTLYSAVGALAGAVASFLIARFLGRETIERYLKGHINFCTHCSDRLLGKIIFFSRLLPMISFDIVSYGAGLTKISLLRFSLASFFGMLPLTFVYNYFGSFMLVSRGFTLLFGLLFVALFFLVPRWIERYDLFGMKSVIKH